MEGENLHPAARAGGSPCQFRIAVGLDFDLPEKVAGRVVQQLVQEHRRLVRRGPVTVAQPSVPKVAPIRLVRPVAQRRPGAQPRVVQQDQPSVGG
jgi:hypothetical protein